MKKVFVVATLNDEKLKKSLLEEAQILAYRKDKTLYHQNMEFYPEGSGSISFNPARNEVTLKFRLNNGEFLAVGSEPGMADKKEIKKKSILSRKTD